MKYTVRFAQWYDYEFEADNGDEAVELAQEKFRHDMRSPIAKLIWDEMIVEDENGKELDHKIW